MAAIPFHSSAAFFRAWRLTIMLKRILSIRDSVNSCIVDFCDNLLTALFSNHDSYPLADEHWLLQNKMLHRFNKTKQFIIWEQIIMYTPARSENKSIKFKGKRRINDPDAVFNIKKSRYGSQKLLFFEEIYNYCLYKRCSYSFLWDTDF